jgi:hypothetical protein
VRQAGHRQQGDHGAVVRQGVHAAAGHGHHAVHHFQRNLRRLAAWMNWSDMAASAMLMPPEAEPVMPASEVTDRRIHQRVGHAAQRLAHHRKPGSAAITPPKPYSEAVFMAASSAPPTAALVPSAKLADAAEGGGHGQQDAQQQRALHRPDADHRFDRQRDRRAGRARRRR